MRDGNNKRISIIREITASLKSRLGILIFLGMIVSFGAVWVTYLYTNKPLLLSMKEETAQQFKTNNEYLFLAETLGKISSISINISRLVISAEQKGITNPRLAVYKLEAESLIAELKKINESTLGQKDQDYYRQLRRSIHDYIISVETVLRLTDVIVADEQSRSKIEPKVKHNLDEENSLKLMVNGLLSKKMTRLKRDYENSHIVDMAMHNSMRGKIELFTVSLSILIIFSGIIVMIINGKQEIKTAMLTENEEALKQSEDTIRLIVKTVGEGIIVVDSNSKILLINEEIKKIFGYFESELIGKNITELMPGKYRERYIYGFNKYVVSGSSQILGQRLELEGRHKHGNVFPIELRVEETVEENGNRYFTGVLRDISDRKIAEERADMFYRMVEASGQGIGMANLDARVTYMNPALCRMLEETRTEMIYGRFIQEFYTPKARMDMETIIMPQVIKEGQWEGETTLLGKNGKTVPVMENIFCVRDKDGSPSYFSMVITDIAERKKMDEEQVRLVKQSIEALQEAEEEREKSDKANRLKSEFLANMSHEFKTPLSSVLGFTRLALKGCEAIENILKESETLNLAGKELEAVKSAMKESKEVVGYNDIVIKQGEKLSVLINELLDLSLIEAGQLKLERRRISAVTMLTSVKESVLPMASAKGIYLDTNEDELNKSNIIFWGDEIRLEQIMRNLAENSVKYSEAGRVTLSIRDVEGRLAIEVSDEGIGISDDERETIFERFRQLDGSATRSHGGIGLGLSLVKKLTEAMGGEIMLDSTPTKGSTFKLLFPLERVIDQGVNES